MGRLLATVRMLMDRSATLVERIASGDQAAEEELVQIYRRRVYAIALARTRDREVSCDLTQDVLAATIKALRARQLRKPDKLQSFIQGIAKNVINSYFRTKVRRSETSLEAVILPAWDGVRESEAAEQRRLMQDELDGCNAIDHEILLLSVVDGISLAEVAKRVNMSYDVVRTRKSRAVRKMIKNLKECHKSKG